MKVVDLEPGDWLTDPTTPECYVRYLVDYVMANCRTFGGPAVQTKTLPSHANPVFLIEKDIADAEGELVINVWRDGVQISTSR